MKDRRVFLFCFFIFFGTSVLVYPQEPAVAAEEADEAEQESAAPEDPEQGEQSLEEGNQELERDTIVLDIKTARYDELVEWAEILGLSSLGSKGEIKNRLYEYYEIPKEEREPEAAPPSQRQRTITIQSARRTEYISREAGDAIVRLLGDISLTINDPAENVTHTIQADELIFNQERKTVTAVGSVYYVLDRGDTSEIFSGESLTFHIDSWEGVFLGGTSTRERTIEGDPLTFKFSGMTISRSDQDVIVVEEGTITSSEADPPNYRIKADKIWIIGPGEWGLRNALLYVGRVPVLYFPFFFKPGDKLFFNPAVGSRTREGNFIQTTTYLIGEKKEETSPFSFLQATETDTDVEKEIQGLFLTDTDIPKRKTGDTGYIKIMADYYTRLGFFSGIQGSFPKLGHFQNLNFLGSFGFSRNIYVQGSSYSPFWEDEEGLLHLYWAKSNLLGISLPFRYGLDTSVKYTTKTFNALGEFELLSDPFFYRDYLNRSEEMDWAKILGVDTGEGTARGITRSFIWRLEANFNPKFQRLNPYITSFTLRKFSTSLSWYSRRIPDSLLPAYIADASDNPGERFFYPDLIVFPSFQLGITGTLLRLPGKLPILNLRSRNKNDTEDDLILPWENPEAAQEDDPDGEEEEPGFILPGLRPAPGTSLLPVSPSFSLSYNLYPSLTLESRTFSSKWQEPGEVDFETEYTLFNSRNTGALRYTYNRWLFSLTGSFQAAGQYRSVLYASPDMDQDSLNSLRNRAYTYSNFRFLHGLNLSLKPLYALENLRDSALSYQLTTILYDRTFDSVSPAMSPVYKNNFIAWNKDMITNHAVSADLKLDIRDNQQSFKVTAKLPPLDPSFSGVLIGRTPFLTGNLSSGFSKTEDEWQPDPLSGSLTVKPGGNFSLTENILYNINNNQMEHSTTSLSLYFTRFNFSMKNIRGFSFDQTQPGWVQDPEERFQPVSGSFLLNFSPEIKPVWKNRIKLDGSLKTELRANFLKFTESSLTFGLTFSISIHKFLDLSLYTQSANQSVYRYIPALTEKVGLTWKNPLLDLLKSFNYFNNTHRYESSFNIQKIGVKAVHYLGDWNLTINYSGQPKLQNLSDGRRGYKWVRFFSLLVQWKPIPEIKRDLKIREGEINF